MQNSLCPETLFTSISKPLIVCDFAATHPHSQLTSQYTRTSFKDMRIILQHLSAWLTIAVSSTGLTMTLGRATLYLVPLLPCPISFSNLVKVSIMGALVEGSVMCTLELGCTAVYARISSHKTFGPRITEWFHTQQKRIPEFLRVHGDFCGRVITSMCVGPIGLAIVRPTSRLGLTVSYLAALGLVGTVVIDFLRFCSLPRRKPLEVGIFNINI